ncbi:alpha/beta hydrolase [Streptomyces olivoreticuli]|uniref:alpha/beta hydrolase n=1 Tax=Streptomyces olivoreticuli TaxID=68246 RepID=UPI002659B814|nr:alpha/beta hydrolase [Streptomyces olivoreticuli]WKK21647.1 alpha/beta hydrolase [Streptomyces olivoreticuli]
MVTIDELAKLDRSKFTKAADAWSKVSNRASGAMGRVEGEMLATLDATQKGDAATAALKNLRQLGKNYRYIHTECGLIRTALTGLAEELEGPQNKLKQALKDAEDLKFTVNPDGSVKYPTTEATKVPFLQQPARAGNVPLIGKLDPNQAKAQEIADRVAAAVQDATEIDGRYAKALSKLNTNGKLDETDWADMARDMKDVRTAAGKHFSEDKIPKGKSPKENAEWWSRLSQAEKDENVALHPDSIGALDGLPAAVRDQANRVVLATQASTEIEQRLHDIEAREPKKFERRVRGEWRVSYEWKRWKEEKDTAEGVKKGMKALQERLDNTTLKGLPEPYLLSFDTKGHGHAVVANGNPDHAQHTAVYVPGTGSRLEKIGDGLGRSDKLWRTSAALAPDQKISTISWYGYEAPQSLGDDAPRSSYANNAAGTVNQFFSGLRASHASDVHQHVTAVAHSYGTTVVGSAARQGDLSADDVVFAGSPGVQVGRASEMDVPKGHVWNEHAHKDDDNVGDWGKYAHGHREGLDFIIPDDAKFGAQQMETDTEGHGGYWDYSEGKDGQPDKPSLSIKNQGRVIVGQYDEVKLK